MPAADQSFADAVQRAGNVVFGEGVTKARAGKNGQPPFALEGTNVYRAVARRSPPGSGTCR